MWIPQTEDEIIQVITSASVSETATFDAKRELPGKSKDLAKDVAAMATDGGVLIYGIAEDDSKRPTVPAPIPLIGAAERVASIVRTSISEPPEILIQLIPTVKDPSVGYLVVVVPPSPRAPHMVTVDKDFRYYGRGPAGNIPLTEGEVARLYERRRRWESNQNDILDEAIQQAPLTATKKYSYLHLVVKPIVMDEGLLDRARNDEAVPTLLNSILSGIFSLSIFPPTPFAPNFSDRTSWHRQLDGWRAYFGSEPRDSSQRDPGDSLDLSLNRDGSGYLFCGRAAEHTSDGLLFFEQPVAGLTTRCLWFFGELYKKAKYYGPVDIGLAVTGLHGAISWELRQRSTYTYVHPLDRPEYRRFDRALAGNLSEIPQLIARGLLMPLIDATTQGSYDPFK